MEESPGFDPGILKVRVLPPQQRIKRSRIWKISKEQLEIVTKNSKTLSEILSFFKLQNKGGNSGTLKKRLTEERIDISHISLGLNHRKGKKIVNFKRIPIEEILIVNSTYTNITCLKQRLIKEGILEYKCRDCLNIGFWNRKDLTLQLEHVNGVSNDHRKENLCFLCPNCHSQTKTYAGKNSNKFLRGSNPLP